MIYYFVAGAMLVAGRNRRGFLESLLLPATMVLTLAYAPALFQ